jgi:hypothetical protein
MSETATPRRRERPSRPIERSEVAIAVAAAVLGAAWGALWQRSAALTDIAAVVPIMLVVLGPALLVVMLGLRLATGAFEMRMDGYAAAIAVVAALIGNVVTPGLAPSISVGGHLTGTLDGAAIDNSASTQCTWGAGRSEVIRVTYRHEGSAITEQLPAGRLTIELPSGAMSLTTIVPGDSIAGPVLPLRNGTGNVGEGSRATGSITLDPAQGALVSGQLTWTCEAPPKG